ncbi:aldo/keto reductase [Candidatus Poribacteria bacterium]|nr:aldo/keto reductase [Candidatus Poribacteria bacterium]
MEGKYINKIPTRVLGRTGVNVTIIGVGGYHIGKARDPQLALRIIRMAIDEGVNFLDNAWCYNDGESERFMGSALKDGYRERVFLMTKNHGRDAATFRRQLDESLSRLQTDHIDLLQFHEIIHEGEPEKIFSQGAIEEAVKAREEGKISYIGFTGHRWPQLFKEMLDKDFDWDTVQMPINLLDYHYRSFTKEILPILIKRKIGVIGMKSLASNQILKTGISADEAITYSLSMPVATLVSGMDSIEVLKKNIETARRWQPLTEKKRNQMLDKVSEYAKDGHLERYKTG